MKRLHILTLALGLLAAVGRPAAAQPTDLSVGYIPILPMAQLFVLEGEGWADDAGLELEFTRFSDGPAIVQALASGDLDVAYVGVGPAMVARANGIDLKVLASNIIEQVALIGRGDFVQTFAEAPDAAAAFAAYHAETGNPVKVATLPAGSVPHTVLKYYLDKVAQVDPAHVEIVGMGADRVQQALLSGAVDAASILEPVLTIVQERDPGARVLAEGGSMFPNQPGAVLAVRERAIAAHPDAIRKLVELHVRATELISSDPERAVAHIEEFVGKGLIDRGTLLAALTSSSSNFVADPHRIVDATQRMQDFQAEIGTLKKPVDLGELFEFRFYDEVESAGRTGSGN